VNAVFSYVRLLVFLACCLVGLQVPVFVDEYGEELSARVSESRVALEEFQDDADLYFEGSLSRLIEHYKTNGDEVFAAGGESIESIHQRNLFLEEKWTAYASGTWNAYLQAIFAPVADVEEAVWTQFNYAVQVDPVSLGFGLTMGLLFTIVSELTFRGCVCLPRRMYRSFRRPRISVSPEAPAS